ncbi:MAG: ABC transporter permease [Lachnospiraceae bacterium]|nr:ABC transporter permease [Lachnospiraceae bacterium]
MKEKALQLIRKVKLQTRIILAITVILLLIILIQGVILKTGAVSLPEQTEALRWSEKKDAAQETLFFSKNAAIEVQNIEQLRYNINKNLAQNSIVTEDESIRLYLDSYCAFGETQLSYNRKQANVNVIAVSGDFFEFHPQKVVYGSLFKSSDIMDDYCILDEETAWYLFGSSDIVGQTIMYQGIPITVMGVYSREESDLLTMAGSREMTVFLPYSLVNRKEGQWNIEVYEIVMPNSVKGFAKGILSQNLPVGEEQCILLENSNRFTYSHYIELWKNRKEFSMKTNDIVFPYWENIARVKEQKLMEVAMIQLLLIAILGLMWFIILLRFLVRHKPTKETFARIGDFIDSRIRKQKTANQRNKRGKKNKKNECADAQKEEK